MEFEIIYYKDRLGKSPIDEFLDELAIKNEPLFNQVSKGLVKLRNRAYHKEPFSKHIEPGLWEVRIIAGTNTLRIFYTFQKGQVIILLHIFIKKTSKIAVKELEIARKRLSEIRMEES